MMTMLLAGVLMFVVTLAIQFALFRFKKAVSFFTGTYVVMVCCVFGIMGKEIVYLAIILGYALADAIGKMAGWHA